MKAAGERPAKVKLPDALWRERRIRPGAKLLWMYLRVAQSRGRRVFTFTALREAIGVCQNSLATYLKELQSAGWLKVFPKGRYAITFSATWGSGGKFLELPTDILFDVTLPEQAKLLWGVIQRRPKSYSYAWLERETGYCRESLIKYLRLLREYGWLGDRQARIKRRVYFAPGVSNPQESKRKKDLDQLIREMAMAQQTPRYSLGQYLMYRKVEFMFPGTLVLEESQIPGVVNPETGGRMHVDLVLPEKRLVLEFYGPQHDRVTQRYPDPKMLAEQQKRDRIKQELCRRAGWHLVIVRAADLSFERLAEMLAPWGPVNLDPAGRWHIYDLLVSAAEEYRWKAAQPDW